jgi:uncharacterized membrane protein
VLPDPPATHPGFQGTAVNELGDVSGSADSPSRAFVVRGGALVELPHLTVEPSSANDINDLGQVVGGSTFNDISGHAVR